MIGFPAVAGPDVAAEISGDLLPRSEEIVLGKLAHDGVFRT
jgi:hypothetical protein